MLSLVDFFMVNNGSGCCPPIRLDCLSVSLISLIVVPELWISLIVVPERYDTNAGNIGRMHGDINEPNPANAETKTVVSTMLRYDTPLLSSIIIKTNTSKKWNLPGKY